MSENYEAYWSLLHIIADTKRFGEVEMAKPLAVLEEARVELWNKLTDEEKQAYAERRRRLDEAMRTNRPRPKRN